MLNRLLAVGALLPVVLASTLAPSGAWATQPAGNNGTVKIVGDGDLDTSSTQPHVGCTFTVEWYGFDAGTDIVSTVAFAMQSPTSDVGLTVDGPSTVFVGADDNSGGGSPAGLDGQQAYTLHFDGAPQPQQGYHVEMTVETPGSQGNDAKRKVFWVTGCTTPAPALSLAKSVTDSADADSLASEGEQLTYAFSLTNTGNVPLTDVTLTDPMIPALAGGAACVATLPVGATTTCPSLPAATHTVTADDVAHGSVDNTATATADPSTGTPVTATGAARIATQATPPAPAPFDWNWKYADPSCYALDVNYPSDIPEGQANDVNVRLETNLGQVTLNFHDNGGTWSGTTSFPFLSHPGWPAGVTSYAVVWTQVGGTNYHWQGSVPCRIGDDGDPTTDDLPLAVTSIDGWRAGTTTVRRGGVVSTDVVSVDQADRAPLTLQVERAGRWTDVRTVATSSRGTARVAFPRQTRRGTFHYRLAVPQDWTVTGTTTRPFTVRVR